MEKYLKETKMLDYSSKNIQQLILEEIICDAYS